MQRTGTPIKRNAGFSLLELGIVLVILTILGTGALSALRLQTERSRLLEAHSMLADAREALLNHAAISGHLPCPDTNGDGEPDSCSGSGPISGRLPWHLLALPERDPWGNALYYSVHSNFLADRTITLKSTGGIEIQAGSSSNTLANAESVVLALWSSGADGKQGAASESPFRLHAETPDNDDQVVWLSRFVLLGRMLEAGRTL
ncbi:type II secretion system protein [Uliginosibacterium paludis]|uniref:Type II secretion system protein n=1 Tax=Uliginosibacterium paludis TaxID=1615952 RepID=A0ABV2CUN7_9RHOO